MGFFEIRRVAKIRRPRELGRYFDRHEIWDARGPSQDAGRDVLGGIVCNEVIIGPVNPNRNCLLTVDIEHKRGRENKPPTFLTKPRGL